MLRSQNLFLRRVALRLLWMRMSVPCVGFIVLSCRRILSPVGSLPWVQAMIPTFGPAFDPFIIVTPGMFMGVLMY